MTKTRATFKAIKWFERTERVWYAGVEDSNGALVTLPASYIGSRGYCSIDGPNKTQAETFRQRLAADIAAGTFAPDLDF